MKQFEVHCCDSLDWTRTQADNSIDLCFCSPPYENRRSYGIGFKLKGQEWVDWAVERFMDQYRICKGLVCWVVDGPVSKFRWSATPAILMADLHRRGVRLRRPAIFQRWGIPGSGGPDFWRSNYEFIICASKGRLPWSDSTATGTPPKYRVGGQMSNRHQDGRRANARCGARLTDGRLRGQIRATCGSKQGDNQTLARYKHPDKVNPGNIIRCTVGGGHMGSKESHGNEAPFPESLVHPFVVSFCPPGGLVFDAFVGSGTTAAVALKNGRRFVGTDIRQSECDRTAARVKPILEASHEDQCEAVAREGCL